MTVSAFFRRNVANNEGDDFEPRLLFTADQRMWDANLLEGDEALPLTTQLSMQEVVQDSVDVDAILSLPDGRLGGFAEYKGEDTALSF
jgi:hypothetical protein